MLFTIKRATLRTRAGNQQTVLTQLCPFFDFILTENQTTAARCWHPHVVFLLLIDHT